MSLSEAQRSVVRAFFAQHVPEGSAADLDGLVDAFAPVADQLLQQARDEEAAERMLVALGGAGTSTVEWGVQYAPGPLTEQRIRWDPTYGGARSQEPYTEAEARQDSLRNRGLPVVKRTRIVYDDYEGEWTYVDPQPTFPT